MKDPLLLSYTFEELMYEFQSMREHEKAALEKTEQEADKIEEAKVDEAQAWADKMEAEEENDPAKEANNIEWMKKQIALDKAAFGEDFGDDIGVDFNSPSKTEEEDD